MNYLTIKKEYSLAKKKEDEEKRLGRTEITIDGLTRIINKRGSYSTLKLDGVRAIPYGTGKGCVCEKEFIISFLPPANLSRMLNGIVEIVQEQYPRYEARYFSIYEVRLEKERGKYSDCEGSVKFYWSKSK